MLGHNQPSFDAVVEENLRRGLYLTQRDTLVRAIKDPRLEPRHLRILAEIIERTNNETGMAYPGRKSLSAATAYWVGGVDQGRPLYTEAGVGKTISELINFGYIMSDKRAPEGGGRALSHYTLSPPSLEDLQLEVRSYLEAIKPARQRPADVTSRSNVRSAEKPSDVTNVGSVREPDVTFRSNVTSRSNVTTGGATVTCSKKYNNIPEKQQPLQLTVPIEAAFEEFWIAFPRGRKQGKGDALDTFKAIVTGQHKRRKASAQALIDGAKRYATTHPDPQYTPLPTTWLNGGRWMDDLPPLPGSGTPAVDEFAVAIERARRAEEEEERCRR